MARNVVKTHNERFEVMRRPVEPMVERILKENETADGALQAVMAMPSGRDATFFLTSGAVLESVIYREISRLGDPTFKEAAEKLQSTTLHRVIGTASAGNVSEITTAYAQQWQLFRFKKSGERVYEVSPGLASRASKTVLRGLRTDMLMDTAVLPYDALYIIVPPESGLVVENVHSGTHVVEGMYVTRDRMSDGTPSWRLMVVGTPKDNPLNDALFHFTMPLPPDTDLEEAIQLEYRRVTGKSEEHGQVFDSAEVKCLDLMPGFFRWAMNIVFYATSADARRQEVWNHPDATGLMERARKHPKGTHKGDRAREALRGAHLRRRTYLGGGLSVLEAAGQGTAREGQSLIVRTLVEGHWRNQAHGPRHTLRKVIWIAPFWRGPEDGPESNPVHVVR